MSQPEAREATRALGAWASGVQWDAVDDVVRERLTLVLLDSLGVTLVGSRLPEQQALVEAWRPGAGPAPLVGSGRTTGVEAAAWLNATAMVRLELDEGNKYAAGHPAAHGLWGVLALAADLDSSGADTAAALLVAYEVAARFGRATRLRPGAHPHGSWGVAGAAAGCARLLGLDAAAVAAAIDTGAGMPVAAHFSSALDGNEVRNAWMGASNLAGLAAARLAAAGGAQCTGTAASSLGDRLGTFDPAALTDGLGGAVGHHPRVLQAARGVLLHASGGRRAPRAAGPPPGRRRLRRRRDPRTGRRSRAHHVDQPAVRAVLHPVRRRDRDRPRRGRAGPVVV